MLQRVASGVSRIGVTARAARVPFVMGARNFSGYDGQTVQDSELIKKSDDWVIEETNFCFGRVGKVRFSEFDDAARRVIKLQNSQLSRMHTRLRDGTVIPYMGLSIEDIVDRPLPSHTNVETGLLKWTWDESYDEAYEEVAPKTLPGTASAKPIETKAAPKAVSA